MIENPALYNEKVNINSSTIEEADDSQKKVAMFLSCLLLVVGVFLLIFNLSKQAESIKDEATKKEPETLKEEKKTTIPEAGTNSKTPPTAEEITALNNNLNANKNSTTLTVDLGTKDAISSSTSVNSNPAGTTTMGANLTTNGTVTIIPGTNGNNSSVVNYGYQGAANDLNTLVVNNGNAATNTSPTPIGITQVTGTTNLAFYIDANKNGKFDTGEVTSATLGGLGVQFGVQNPTLKNVVDTLSQDKINMYNNLVSLGSDTLKKDSNGFYTQLNLNPSQMIYKVDNTYVTGDNTALLGKNPNIQEVYLYKDSTTATNALKNSTYSTSYSYKLSNVGQDATSNSLFTKITENNNAYTSSAKYTNYINYYNDFKTANENYINNSGIGTNMNLINTLNSKTEPVADVNTMNKNNYNIIKAYEAKLGRSLTAKEMADAEVFLESQNQIILKTNAISTIETSGIVTDGVTKLNTLSALSGISVDTKQTITSYKELIVKYDNFKNDFLSGKISQSGTDIIITSSNDYSIPAGTYNINDIKTYFNNKESSYSVTLNDNLSKDISNGFISSFTAIPQKGLIAETLGVQSQLIYDKNIASNHVSSFANSSLQEVYQVNKVSVTGLNDVDYKAISNLAISAYKGYSGIANVKNVINNNQIIYNNTFDYYETYNRQYNRYYINGGVVPYQDLYNYQKQKVNTNVISTNSQLTY